jgi:hypothetical protein
MMASATARALMRLRPVGLGGSSSARIGAIRAHRSSGTRQIVGTVSRARVVLVQQPHLHSRPCQAMIVTLVESKRVPSCTCLITTALIGKAKSPSGTRVFWQLGDHTQRMILRLSMHALVSFSLPARRPYALFFSPRWTKNDAKRKANAGWISDGCCWLEVGFVDDGRIASTASAPESKANAPAR